MPEVTQILHQIGMGDAAAASELLPLVYAELRRLAQFRMQREVAGHTLQPTALVHEAYVRLVSKPAHAAGPNDTQWQNRGQFFGAAAEAMRRILIENARQRKSLKRGGEFARFAIAEDDAIVDPNCVDELLDLDAALNKLADEEPDLARLVELRYFAGLSVGETADAMGVSSRTVKRNWSFARAWLGRQMHSEVNR
ncbi:ECF-type sigma factor [Allorhodopirellula solitaria]|uniref:RNA polymerase sigma factor SigL n=1 Tax=Allorhodopirellula solitaria TaxID=2527987 RepID=A0A5C5YGB0_9BACT|nr:ECF-type sigma factor [Allorhodopirellula solitaria]TWT74019.1 RNA polymerase sigma factor SigL [Allorhodopirellula solitaria]